MSGFYWAKGSHWSTVVVTVDSGKVAVYDGLYNFEAMYKDKLQDFIDTWVAAFMNVLYDGQKTIKGEPKAAPGMIKQCDYFNCGPIAVELMMSFARNRNLKIPQISSSMMKSVREAQRQIVETGNWRAFV